MQKQNDYVHIRYFNIISLDMTHNRRSIFKHIYGNEISEFSCESKVSSVKYISAYDLCYNACHYLENL